MAKNGYKKLLEVRGIDVDFKILMAKDIAEPTISIVASSEDESLLINPNPRDGRYYSRYLLTRTEWAENQNYSNHSVAVGDFEAAIYEFDNCNDWHNYQSKVNQYLMDETKSLLVV